MAESSVLSVTEVRRLLPDALQRPAPEGARLVARHFLQQLLETREQWRHVAAGTAGASAAPAVLLHAARVSLRRLRATLREHDRVLERVADRRVERALRGLGRATNARRDADVQRAWLDAEREHLAPDARAEAQRLRDRLAAPDQSADGRVEAAFARYLDPIADTLLLRLDSYRLTHRVGHDPAPTTFARQLGTRLARGGVRLRRDLAAVQSPADQDAMHAVRIRLKRHRALLAPFARSRPALGAWFDSATRAQDLLGTMRDAHLLAERARKARLPALARALDDTVLGQFAAFRQDWLDRTDEMLVALDRAVAVLHTEGRAVSTSGVPMEIERKYLLHACPPEAQQSPGERIEQGWIPGTEIRERLRRRTRADGSVSCSRTMKLGPAEARIELEESMPEELFETMWPLTSGARVRKVRHMVPWGPHAWEIDVFLDRELVLAEVELETLDEAVEMPAWLAPFLVRDVTGEPAYFNTALARADG
jgi:CYTH domain-containing protein/CHAD domain-containing protein